MESIRNRLLLIVCLVLGLCRPALADAPPDGLAALKAGDYAAALAQLTPLADAGDPKALFALSQMHSRGLGVPADTGKALHYLELAAERGYVIAQYNLGNHYINGQGLKQDAARAAYWWRLAAGQGMPQAQYNLGNLYFYGQGVGQDRDQASFWYRQAAEAGSLRARQALAVLEDLETTGGSASKSPVTTENKKQTYDFSRLALGVDWVRAQSADDFCLQLFASEHPEAIERFLTGHRFQRQVAVFPFSRDGSLWYAIVYGRFDTRQQASQSVNELPPEARGSKPWIRDFGHIQSLLGP